ncbi:hypothetical protein [Demequina sp. NBRC 110056]|uniref:hypothetical protein n=1 Tax=Demequina sp. NBRC 110056 TaxID=1570345 RepID=UPI0009FEE7C7|nr:hypothetical protein [Demequina sp. NBRC 110056]
MRDLGDDLKARIGAHARAGAGAHAPGTVRRAIRRRRRRSAMGIGAGSALGVGLLAVAAVTTAGSLAEPEEALPSPSVSSTAPIAYATLDLDDPTTLGWYGAPETLGCGEAPPEPRATDGDFAADFDITVDGELSQDSSSGISTALGTAHLTATPTEKQLAFVHQPYALFVRDGVVVGFDGAVGSRDWWPIGTEWSFSPSLEWWNYTVGCESFETSYEPLPAGEYEMYIVARISASESEAAVYDLETHGMQVMGGGSWESMEPGSFECEQYADWDSYQPLVCDPGGLPGTTIDRSAGTATVPYDASLYSGDLDITLVSEPVTVTLGERIDHHGTDGGPGPLEAGEVPACGETYGWFEGGEALLHWSGNLGSIDAGDTIEPGVWVWGDSWAEASVTMPDDGRLWLFAGEDLTTEDGFTTWVERVVGWADVTSMGDATLDIVRFDGPASWPLSVTDLQWCEGFEEAAERIASSVMVATITITDDMGTRDSEGPLQMGNFW